MVQQPGVLQGKKDPEVKRKTIGAGFIEVFRDFAITLKTKHGIRPKYLVQVRLASSWLPCLQNCFASLLMCGGGTDPTPQTPLPLVKCWPLK